MKSFCIILLILPLSSYLMLAQSDTLKLIKTFEVEGKMIAVDKLQQFYTLDENQLVRKYTPQGKTSFEYQDRQLGDLKQLDATDPFSLLLFYPEFNTLVLLDRTLNLLTELNLGELGFFSVDLAATSRDNQIWIYDQQDFKLKKIDRQGRTSAESQDLSLWFPGGIQGELLIATGASVYLLNAGSRLMEFNQFGQFQRSYELPKGKLIGMEAPYFFFYLEKEKQLIAYQSLDGQMIPVFRELPKLSSALFKANFFFLQEDQQVQSFSW